MMLYLLFGLLLTPNQEAFKHFKKSGSQAACLIDYQKKTIKCDYRTMGECRQEYNNYKMAICCPRKDLKLHGDN
jgi:hypothetical protein